MNHRMRAAWLFVPADNQHLFEKASRGPTDVVIFDLEDSVSHENKRRARSNIVDWLSSGDQTQPLCIRVNNTSEIDDDLDCVVRHGVSSLMLPKTETAEELVLLDGELSRREASAGLAIGSIGVVALIETPKGVLACREIAAAPRVTALALGTEDFATNMGALPSAELYSLPLATIAIAAAAAGVGALGIDSSLRDFTDAAAFRGAVERAVALGVTGCLCIHPRQVRAAQAVFSPSLAETVWARRIITAWRDREPGSAAIAVDGEMVDKPVAELAAKILTMSGCDS